MERGEGLFTLTYSFIWIARIVVVVVVVVVSLLMVIQKRRWGGGGELWRV